MLISCAFAPSPATPDHIALAEALGYRRAWCYDSPALYADAWMVLALAAQRTGTIGLGPGVLVPNLRHPVTNAAAVMTLEALAPGRVAVALGTGFTATGALGQKSLRWSEVTAYVEALRTLLRGADAVWDGRAIRMMQPAGFAPGRPVEVPILIAASGPKGLEAARALGTGVFLGPRPTAAASQFAHAAALITGTVLDEGEDATSERVLAAAGHSAAMLLHGPYETRPDALGRLPGGLAWKATVDALPAATRHLALHDRHHVGVNDVDRPFITPELLARVAFTPAALRDRLASFESYGVTEVAYQPAGPTSSGSWRRSSPPPVEDGPHRTPFGALPGPG